MTKIFWIVLWLAGLSFATDCIKNYLLYRRLQFDEKNTKNKSYFFQKSRDSTFDLTQEQQPFLISM